MLRKETRLDNYFVNEWVPPFALRCWTISWLGHLALHFLHNDYRRWITANEVLCNCKERLFTTRQAMSVERNSEARSHNHCCLGKPITITYSWCVSVALVTQHLKRMRRIILLSATCPALPHFSTLPHKRHDFPIKKKGYWTQNACFDFLYKFCLKHFLL